MIKLAKIAVTEGIQFDAESRSPLILSSLEHASKLQTVARAIVRPKSRFPLGSNTFPYLDSYLHHESQDRVKIFRDYHKQRTTLLNTRKHCAEVPGNAIQYLSLQLVALRHPMPRTRAIQFEEFSSSRFQTLSCRNVHEIHMHLNFAGLTQTP